MYIIKIMRSDAKVWRYTNYSLTGMNPLLAVGDMQNLLFKTQAGAMKEARDIESRAFETKALSHIAVVRMTNTEPYIEREVVWFKEIKC